MFETQWSMKWRERTAPEDNAVVILIIETMDARDKAQQCESWAQVSQNNKHLEFIVAQPGITIERHCNTVKHVSEERALLPGQAGLSGQIPYVQRRGEMECFLRNQYPLPDILFWR